MTDVDHILAAIDSCLEDETVSEDAMRWAPDEPDPTPEDDSLIDQMVRFVEEHLDFPVYGHRAVAWSGREWPIARDNTANALGWSSTISAARDAVSAELGALDGLLRISMPDASESFHRVVDVTPGETLGEYVLTLEPVGAALSEFAGGLSGAAASALAGFGQAFGPVVSATQAVLHQVAYRDDRKHYRRCPTCNPAGNPKPMSINRAEYRRRRR